MGDLNNEIASFCDQIQSNDDLQRSLATHSLVYMARGIFSRLSYPFGYFASHDMTSSQLYACTTEAMRVLASINLCTRALVSDGASSNRKFYQIMSKSHWTHNPHNDDKKIYFLPHLLKTTRNCMENSGWNRNVRSLEVCIKQIKKYKNPP